MSSYRFICALEVFLDFWVCDLGLLGLFFILNFFNLVFFFALSALFQSGNISLGLEVLEKRVPDTFAALVYASIYFLFMWV